MNHTWWVLVHTVLKQTSQRTPSKTPLEHIQTQIGMASKLEHMNMQNGKAKQLEARVKMPVLREVKGKNMDVFSCVLLSESGHYCQGEAIIFGDKANRSRVGKALATKWVGDSTWKLSALTFVPKKSAFQSAPHSFVLNLGDKNLKAETLTGERADKLPLELEPPLTSGELLAFEMSQLVDAYGYICEIPTKEVLPNGKSVIKPMLTDKEGKQVPLCFWEELQDRASQIKEKTIIYVYGAYLVVESTGGVHLTARDTTVIVKASGDSPLAKKLLAANLSDKKKEEMIQLSKAPPATDHADGPAVSVSAGILECATYFKKVLPESLFETSGGLVNLLNQEKDQILDRSGSRIWTKVQVTDYTGTVLADMNEKTALVLTDTSDKEEFLEQAENGSIAFSRGRLRFRWAVGKDKTEPTLTLVGAKPLFFDIPESHPTPPSDARLIPAQLHWANTSPTGLIAVKFPDTGNTRMATGILAVVAGHKEARTEPIEGGFAIINSVTEACGADTTTVWSATTSTKTQLLSRYALPKKELALVHLTNVDSSTKSVTIANMWKLPTGHNIEPFLKEITETAKILGKAPHGVKRTRESFDTELQGLLPTSAKRIHAVMGGETTCAA